MHVGKRFKQILREKGVTQSEFGRMCGMTRGAVYYMTKSKSWNSDNILRAVKHLGVSADDLLRD